MSLRSVLFGLVLSCGAAGNADDSPSPVDIGSRRELFVDEALIESLRDARRVLHSPTPREIAIRHDAPWEGAGSGYHSVLHDGERYRMYYRGSKLGVAHGKLVTGPEVYCYAESRDGVTFTKPELGLHEFQGSKKNNIIWTGVGTHNFAPFIDTRPGCPPESRYKALGGLPKQGGLFAFHSGLDRNLAHFTSTTRKRVAKRRRNHSLARRASADFRSRPFTRPTAFAGRCCASSRS